MRSSRRQMLLRHRNKLATWAGANRRLLIRIGGAAALVLLVIQILYPADRLPLFASIDGMHLSGTKKSDAIKRLDDRYSKQTVELSLGKVSPKFDTPLASTLGVTASNKGRVERATYPWYVRVIPTSLLWFGLLQNEHKPTYGHDDAAAKAYLVSKVGNECVIPAKDASLQVKESKLEVVLSKEGGTCDFNDAAGTLKKLSPRISSKTKATIPMTVVAPTVGDDSAKKLGNALNKSSKGGVELKVADKLQKIEQKEVLSWLTFKTEGEDLGFDINADKANAYLAKTATPVIAKPAGVTKVSTSDFTETSRQEGQTGQTLDLKNTLAEVRAVLTDDKDQARARVTSLAPKVEYTRTYSKSSTGIAALIKFYDDDNGGDFGVSFSELGGQGLSAQHNGDKQFVTASTYKLFVAFSTIKRVEKGDMKWDDADIASGRDLNKCFDDMIVKSDNACAEALIKKIGAKDLNADIKSIGLSATAFKSDNNVTTANDLAKYLTQLEKGSLPIKTENRDRLLGAMKRNVYRQGVPAGASGQTADKVGFLWGLLHDAAIVYSPKGTYVLVVMSDGSSWANIADLTRRIEALR